MLGGETVQLFDGDVQQGRHLVDKGTRTAGTGTVHPYFHTAGQKQDFGIFSAQFDDDIRIGNKGLGRNTGRIDLLNKIDAADIGYAHTSGTGHGDDSIVRFWQFTAELAEQLRNFFRYL